ncbi:ThiF family adenylyltransferase [Oxalicibacterium faecigallinarum]|uniref:ThiF family adenylyltransferase n=1 Tax=Oxalicibacterium faecigallinarum TaxID=573741 RepID=UPI0016661068|nr:ThiF family adenylyltransferase [Oxalicibacterium faecigallinarum]
MKLEQLQHGREISFAEVILPKGFPEQGIARIQLPSDAELRIPHVERGGLLCLDGDPGPGRGLDATERIEALVKAFFDKFFDPWRDGQLDYDFGKEPQNYWTVNVLRKRTNSDTAIRVLTVDDAPPKPQVRGGLLLQPSKFIIAGDADNPFVQRIVESLGHRSTQCIRVIIADIPISKSFVPSTWPKDVDSLLRVVRARLKLSDQRRFFEQKIRSRRTREHRIVLFRNQEGGFAYVLPGGPPVVHQEGIRKRARQPHTGIQPLLVDRVDPAWTVGRDQIPQVTTRQEKNIVVFGAGALGSPVVEQLAKAGIGRITVVDSDAMESANVGRHLLGVPHINYGKASSIAKEVGLRFPSCAITHHAGTAENWLRSNTLANYDTTLDLTGEPEVRWQLNEARKQHPCQLVVGWMEPFVAGAHVCMLTPQTLWFPGASIHDRLNELEAINWPAEVIKKVPGCSSRFQAYTAANAAYAVALISENALRLIDEELETSQMLSWVRGRQFLDKQWSNLTYREWAEQASPHVGVTIERSFV